MPRNVFLVTALALTASVCLARADHGRLVRLPIVLAQVVPDTAGTSPLRPVEKAFVVDGLETTRAQADFARLAVSQARSSAVRELAQQLVGDCREINVSLEAMARRKAIPVPIQPTSFSSEYRRLADHAGTDFDRVFIRELATANARLLRLCEATVANARDTDIRDAAGGFLPVVRDHINKTTELLKTL